MLTQTSRPDWPALQRKALAQPRVRASAPTPAEGLFVKLPAGVYVALTVNK